MGSTEIGFRSDIQGLRAVAVALVVFSHSKVPGFAGGFVGVDVFFVLSGYLITGLLLEERLSTGGIRYGQFLARRLRRLLPAMLVMLVVVLVTGSIFLTAFEMRMQAGSFPYAATWISNFFFAFAERDYFLALQSKDLFLHTWSLGVEEQFYLIWPWIMLLFTGSFFKSAQEKRRIVFGALAVIFIAGLAFCLYLSEFFPVLSFYMMPARAWQFAIGAAVFVGLNWPAAKGDVAAASKRFTPIYSVLGWFGLFLVFGATFSLTSSMTYPGYLALIPSLGAGFLIAAGKLDRTAGVSRIFSWRPFVWVGDRSYSIYLWHWPVLILGDSLGVSRSATGVSVLVALSVLIAAISYRWVEYPIWKGIFSRTSGKKVALVALSAVVMALSISIGLEKTVYGSSANRTVSGAYNPRQDAPVDIYRADSGCDSGHFSPFLIPCGIGAVDGKYVAVVLGDSIAAQWSTMISGVFSAPDWQVIVLTKSACAIVDESYYYGKVGGTYKVCTEWRNSALEYIADIDPDIVVVGSAVGYEFSKSQWIDGSSRIMDRLSRIVDHVIVIPGTPRLSFDGPSCIEDPFRFSFRLIGGGRECEETESGSLRIEVTSYLADVAEKFSNIVLLDMSDLICPDGKCAAQSANGMVVFRDELHITASFAESLIPMARDRLIARGVNIHLDPVEHESEGQL